MVQLIEIITAITIITITTTTSKGFRHHHHQLPRYRYSQWKAVLPLDLQEHATVQVGVGVGFRV